MSKIKTKATARARLTFEMDIDLTSTWGDDCTVGQVKSQADDGAKHIANILAERMSNTTANRDGIERLIKMRLIGVERRITVVLDDKE